MSKVANYDQAVRGAVKGENAHNRKILNPAPKCRCGKRAQYFHRGGSWVCTKCEPFDKKVSEALVAVLLDETVVTSDRVLNHVLMQAGGIIGRRDVTPLDKFETLVAYLLKARREVLGKPEE